MHKCTYKTVIITGNGASQAGSSAMPTEKIENIIKTKAKIYSLRHISISFFHTHKKPFKPVISCAVVCQ